MSQVVQTWRVTRLFFWNSEKRKTLEKFIVSDESGKQVCSNDNLRNAVEDALRIAARQRVAVQVVGSGI
jgi:electron transfer flavoprotein alpha/beta subunit